MAQQMVEHSLGCYYNEKGRGPAKLKHLIKMKDNEERIKVVYNGRGQPIGDGKKDLASYAGMLVKSCIPITYKDWHEVPNTMKKNLWNDIQVKFDVDLKTEKAVLSSMASSWKRFKSMLSRSWIYPYKNQPELLKHPPKKYRKLVDQSTWDEFVRNRLSKNFQLISRLQSERRAKNKYNHRLSKKGYAGLAEELKEKMGPLYKDDRSFLWAKARQNKEGEYGDDATKEVADKIFALKRQVEDGIIVTRGSVDVLTMALGTPEHSGRVRGQGSGVVPTKYFDMPKRVSEKYVSDLEFKLHEENRKRKEAEQLLQDLQAQMDKFPHESVTSLPQEEIASDAHINDSREYLRSSTKERGSLENNKIQTCSSKFKDDGKANTQQEVSHPMYIKWKFKGDGISKTQQEVSHPISDQRKSKGDGKASTQQVSHPISYKRKGKNRRSTIGSKTNNVEKGMDVEGKKRRSTGGSKTNITANEGMDFQEEKIDDGGDLQSGEIHALIDTRSGENVALIDAQSRDNGALIDAQFGENAALIDAFAHTLQTMKIVEIVIPVDKEIFGEENVKCRVCQSDLLGFCAMKALNTTCIAIYTRYLYDKRKSSREIVKFFNPASISSTSKLGISRLITKRLQNAKGNEICFIPYYIQTKFHWALIVIDCPSMVVFWLDSLNTKPDEQTKFYINTGLNSIPLGRRPSPTWNLIECPRQTGNWDSGYFLMKFMRELMESSFMSINTEMRKLAEKATYTLEEINEVRVEFMEFIVEHL